MFTMKKCEPFLFLHLGLAVSTEDSLGGDDEHDHVGHLLNEQDALNRREDHSMNNMVHLNKNYKKSRTLTKK